MKLDAVDAAIAERRACIARDQEDLRALERTRAILSRSNAAVRANQTRRGKEIVARVAGRLRRRRLLHPLKNVLMEESDAGRARQEILDAGKPLHIDTILDQIEKRTGKRPKRTSLVGGLARYAKEGRHFYRAGPNTFGLIEKKKGAS